MKIGIVTFHRAQNYGAVLQMFALQKFLIDNGHQVEFIDYRNKQIEKNYRLIPVHILFERKNIFKSLELFKNKILTFSIRKSKAASFNKFCKKHLNFSPEINVENLESLYNYNILITGSDQVWNSTITGGIDKFYYLDFSVQKGAKRISYAASTEKYNYPFIKSNAKEFSVLMTNFDAISVREHDVAEIIKPLTDKPVHVVLDPTLLLEEHDYHNIISPPKDENYILVYHLGWKKELIEIAESMAKEKGLKIIEIHAGVKPFLETKRHKQDLEPEAFLGYLKNATYIITTSFHGTAFSIIFKKEFYVFDNGAAMRQYSLLKSLGIENRLIKKKTEINLIETIDFEKLNLKLESLKSLSKDFLLSNIK